MNISEEEKKQILSKYNDNTSNEVLNHIKRHYPKHTTKLDWLDKPLVGISINGKIYWIESKKKFLVNRIFGDIESIFSNIDKPTIRRTIKKYIDGISF